MSIELSKASRVLIDFHAKATNAFVLRVTEMNYTEASQITSRVCLADQDIQVMGQRKIYVSNVLQENMLIVMQLQIVFHAQLESM